jgi:hypothetical protein
VEDGQPCDRTGITPNISTVSTLPTAGSLPRIWCPSELVKQSLVRLAKVHPLDSEVVLLFVELFTPLDFRGHFYTTSLESSLYSILHTSSPSSAHRVLPSLLPALPQFDLKAIATATAKPTNQHRHSAVTRRLVANYLR